MGISHFLMLLIRVRTIHSNFMLHGLAKSVPGPVVINGD